VSTEFFRHRSKRAMAVNNFSAVSALLQARSHSIDLYAQDAIATFLVGRLIKEW
jgi:hypothetical protein